MAGPEELREDGVGTLVLVQLLLLGGAVRVDVWTSVWLAATEQTM